MATVGFRCNEPEPVSDDDDDDEVVTVVQPVGEAPASASPALLRVRSKSAVYPSAEIPTSPVRGRRRTVDSNGAQPRGRPRSNSIGGAPSSGGPRRNSINPRRNSIHAAAMASAAAAAAAASEANTSGLRDDFIDHTEGSSKLLLHPLSKARQTWDIFLIVTLFAFAIFYPLRLSFLDPRGASPAWRAVDIALTAVFGFDILLTLRTGIVVDRTLILSPRKIALRYARGWLLVDLLAALPLDLLVARPAGGLNLWAWSRFIKVLRLYSLGQYRYFDKVMKAVDVHFGVMTCTPRNSVRNSAQFSNGHSITSQTSRPPAASPSSSACAPTGSAARGTSSASPSRRRGATAAAPTAALSSSCR